MSGGGDKLVSGSGWLDTESTDAKRLSVVKRATWT